MIMGAIVCIVVLTTMVVMVGTQAGVSHWRAGASDRV